MKVNLPVSQHEHELPDDAILVSTTDLSGHITHCNQGFVDASGFDFDELLGQPHDVVRHPDMPSEAFKDMWSTIGHGRPWSGIVKNRRKNGDHYWVQANVTPVMENNKPKAYMSVRLKARREQVDAAQALYARIAEQRQSGRHTFRLHAGNVRPLGWRDTFGKLHRLTLNHRIGIGLVLILLLTLLPGWWFDTLDTPMRLGLQFGGGILGAALFVGWFSAQVTTPLKSANALASQLAGCNLNGQYSYDTTSPLGTLMRGLWLTNLNMRAIVADVRSEVAGVRHAADDLLQGSLELAGRTDAQADEVERTSASVMQIASIVRETADTAQSLASLSSEASSGAAEGALSIGQVSDSMHRIESSSKRVTDIIDVIEQLAFQTNLLALNAAVEAAHAGEDGRGFAVVASEVRALAHRSSKAATQIREMIQASSLQVTEGTQNVDAAADTIHVAVEKVHLVTERLGTITLATREESAGVKQISDAMCVLDEVTRQNASLVQQSSEACQALAERANNLQRVVTVFSLNSD
ncbi:MAG: PAS domain-containing protein [Rhodoferax sp.]|uniref:methyl-accepting chemotaxis protein n=1 Tax=Rhodoferax sp. TaxID=50421 RepID=UPI001B3DBE8F|nr:PAS domain-containing methyl-accepting chemotaxis protein [Rhodoferax sp.]MBP9905173.1 PAS domain-containing protein [Rhodoferax sp.]